MIANVDTGNIGKSAPKASPCAIPVPIRTPVKLPGPRPNASASKSVNLMPASDNKLSTMGKIRLVCSRGLTNSLTNTSPLILSAAEQFSVDVSSAKILLIKFTF